MQSNTINIYSQIDSPRTRYIISHMFSNIAGCECCFVDSPACEGGLHINYSASPVNGCINIVPYDTDSRHFGLSEGLPAQGEWEGLPTMFHTGQGDTGFDIFAAAFYCISRAEEYNNARHDIHGRFDVKESTAYKFNILHRPIVDEWCMQLKKLVSERFPYITFHTREFRVIPTMDIDHPFKYRNKGIILTTYGYLRDLVRRNFPQVMERTATLIRRKDDPYFCFDYIADAYERHDASAKIFILMADYGKYDRKTIYYSLRFNRRIRMLAAKYETGIHPSYRASFDRQRIIKEINRLNRITDDDITSGRFHFLRIRIPDSYRTIAALGIRDDYTMMYAGDYGFRAGTSIPFHFYDIDNERETDLTIHPTCAMDTTLRNVLHMTPDQAITALSQLRDRVREVGGDFVTLFHNSSLGEDYEWKGWRRVFETVL